MGNYILLYYVDFNNHRCLTPMLVYIVFYSQMEPAWYICRCFVTDKIWCRNLTHKYKNAYMENYILFSWANCTRRPLFHRAWSIECANPRYHTKCLHDNYANPVYCVANICHQVRCLHWWHLSLFHTATSLLIWYKLFCMRDIIQTLYGWNL